MNDKPLTIADLDELERQVNMMLRLNHPEWVEGAERIVIAAPELLRLARAQLQLPAEVVLMRTALEASIQALEWVIGHDENVRDAAGQDTDPDTDDPMIASCRAALADAVAALARKP